MKLFNAAYKSLFIFLLFPTICYGFAVQSAKITASGGSPIPVAYDHTDSQSLILTGTNGKRHLIGINETAGRVALNIDAADVDISPPDSGRNIFIPAGGFVALDELAIGNKIHLRSDSGAPLTADDVLVFVW